MRYVLGIIAICFSVGAAAQSNEGTLFWMGFLEKFELGKEERVLMITSQYNTQGTVTIPGINWFETFTVQAQEVTLVSIPIEAIAKGSENITQTGIEIKSLDPIVVYAHQYETNRAEASVILPISSLGTEYLAMCYEGYSREENGLMVHYPSEFLVVATEDNTEIRLRVSSSTLGGLLAGDARTLILNKGEAYQVQSLEGAGQDLTGSEISSNKPIAVFSGNFWTQVPNGCDARDNLYEQVYPTASWGRQFALAPQRRTSNTRIRILASEDNTPVEVLGNTAIFQFLNRGEFLEFELGGSAYVASDKPLLVTQFSQGRACNDHPQGIGDPAMVLINSIEQTRDSVTVFASSFQNINETYINIVVRTEDIPSVRLNGNLVSDISSFEVVSGNPTYSFAQVQVESGTHNLSSEGCGINATLYGYGEAESYAYAAGANFPVLNPEKLRELTGGCVGEEITFDSGLAENVFTFEWDFGDGTQSFEPIPLHAYAAEGTYQVQLTVRNVCLNKIDTYQQELIISAKPQVLAGNDTTLCANQPLVLAASFVQDGEYRWVGPALFAAEEQMPLLPNMRPQNEGTYEVTVSLQGCESDPAQTTVTLRPIPTPNLGADTVLCEGEEFSRSPGIFPAYRWQDGSAEAFQVFTVPGIYWVEVVDSIGCTETDTLVIEEGCPVVLFIPSAFSPNADGVNDRFQIIGDQFDDFLLEVYDRWGRIVFTSESPRASWDGDLKGGPAPEGVYTYRIAYSGLSKEGLPFSQHRFGTITLIR